MIKDEQKALMMKFLQRNYPVSRVKFKDRFKRGMVLNNAIILLSTKEDYLKIVNPITDILVLVFGCTHQSAKAIVKKYYMITIL